MRNKLFALILALTVVSWAQTATQTTPSVPAQRAPAETTKAACCHKMATDSKDGHAACMRKGDHAGTKDMASCCAGKEVASCCGGKDAKSCMKDDKTMASCCKDSCGKDKATSCCDRKAGKGCCGSSKTEKPA